MQGEGKIAVKVLLINGYSDGTVHKQDIRNDPLQVFKRVEEAHRDLLR